MSESEPNMRASDEAAQPVPAEEALTALLGDLTELSQYLSRPRPTTPMISRNASSTMRSATAQAAPMTSGRRQCWSTNTTSGSKSPPSSISCARATRLPRQ